MKLTASLVDAEDYQPMQEEEQKLINEGKCYTSFLASPANQSQSTRHGRRTAHSSTT